MPDVPRVNWIVRTMAGAGQALYYDTLFRFKQEYTFSIIQTEYITSANNFGIVRTDCTVDSRQVDAGNLMRLQQSSSTAVTDTVYRRVRVVRILVA